MDKIKAKEFQIYAKGPIHCSVCTSLSVEEATERVNVENPTGIMSKWKISDENFVTGEPNPHSCECLKTHNHMLFVC